MKPGLHAAQDRGHTRREFRSEVRKKAWARSGGVCEATGEFYGLPPGLRCTADLNLGVQYDHVLPDGLSGAPILENCAAVCPKCRRWKTDKRDKPAMSKADRILAKRTKTNGRSHRKMQSRGFR